MSPARRLPFPVLILLVVTVAFCIPSASAQSKEDKKTERAEAQALLDKAAALTNIEAAGSQPFVYIADATWIQNGKTTTGRLGIVWQQIGRYREQIATQRFLQTEIVSKDILYRRRNYESPPLAGMWWQSMFSVSELFTKWPKNPKLDNAYLPQELSGLSNFSCATAESSVSIQTVQQIACFDNSNALPLLFKVQYGPNIATRVFSDYASIGEKRFPRQIMYADSTGVRGVLKASRFAAFSGFSDDTFQAAPNSSTEPWCSAPVFESAMRNGTLRLLMQQQPVALRLPNLDDPYMFIMINAKGRADKVFFVGKPSNFSEERSANSIYQTQFLVKYCGKQAVPYEMFVQQAFPYLSFFRAPIR